MLLVALLAGCQSAPPDSVAGAEAGDSSAQVAGGSPEAASASPPSTVARPGSGSDSPDTGATVKVSAEAEAEAGGKAEAGAGAGSSTSGDFPSHAVTAIPADLKVYAAPDGRVAQTLANPQPSGAPLTFLLDERRPGWLKVFLPVRPNGSTGWVRESDVEVSGVPYRLDLVRSDYELRLYRFDKLVETFPVGIGADDTPTPGGTFYIKELLAPTNEDGMYGPYAFGLSGFSNSLDSFAGGEAVIGIHGTNDPSSVGQDVSNGCIRMHNADVTELAQMLPLGTPVRILA